MKVFLCIVLLAGIGFGSVSASTPNWSGQWVGVPSCPASCCCLTNPITISSNGVFTAGLVDGTPGAGYCGGQTTFSSTCTINGYSASCPTSLGISYQCTLAASGNSISCTGSGANVCSAMQQVTLSPSGGATSPQSTTAAGSGGDWTGKWNGSPSCPQGCCCLRDPVSITGSGSTYTLMGSTTGSCNGQTSATAIATSASSSAAVFSFQSSSTVASCSLSGNTMNCAISDPTCPALTSETLTRNAAAGGLASSVPIILSLFLSVIAALVVVIGN